MKGKIKVMAFAAIMMSAMFISCVDEEENGIKIAKKQQKEATTMAVKSVPIPQVTQFAERSTVARWTKVWDSTTKPCYVYLYVPGVGCIGYYISSGKPASSRNYLVPEYTERAVGGNGAVINDQQPDLDGTYGDNNPGIRFFTASGSAVEFGGSSFSYVYSDVKLNINVPCLGK